MLPNRCIKNLAHLAFADSWITHFLRLAIAFSLLLLIGNARCRSETREWTPRESIIKTALLMNFARFTRFPELGSEMVICVLGNNPFGEPLKSIEKKRAADRPIRTTTLEIVDERINECNVVFISSSLKEQIGSVLKSLEGNRFLRFPKSPTLLEMVA